jgi:N-methylhydantoinase A/oxoprolinase/acetone carboxylase beta subunit
VFKVFLGVDVGGTHTDAVLLEETKSGVRPVDAAKARTSVRVIESLARVFDELLTGGRAASLKRLTVSTTLGLNSLLTGAADPVGVMTTGGPGLELDPGPWGPLYRALPAQQDHRGHVVEALDPRLAREAAADLVGRGAATLVVGSKFGPKNTVLEEVMRTAGREVCPGPVMSASALFGGLNFPRRLGGAVLNAAVKRLYDRFLDDLGEVAAARGLGCPVCVLKSDGGVMGLAAARARPVLALTSGPAASLLGLWALSDASGPSEAPDPGDVLMVDMGGTSTDLAVFSRGSPLMTSEGLTIAGRPTLVKGLLTHSAALGGDTDLAPVDGRLVPAPVRRGPALALAPGDLGLRPPTLTDALNALGRCAVGDPRVSLRAFELLAPGDPVGLARQGVGAVLEKLADEIKLFLERINQQPVYTVGDFLVDWRLEPNRAVFLGGPAETLAPLAGEALGLACSAPAGAATANALGAALARPTVEAELYADTDHGLMSAPTLGESRKINPSYNLDQAKQDLLDLMGGRPDVRVTSAESFSQFHEYGRAGKVIRVTAQSAPGLVARLAGPPPSRSA